MSQKNLAFHLKLLIIGTALCGLLVYLLIMPHCLIEMFPDSSEARAIWMVYLLISLLPCYGVLFLAWQIAARIGRNRSFCRENAIALKQIARIAMADTAFVLLTQTVFLLLDLSRSTIAMFAVVLVFVGVALSTVASALAHLIDKAATLQEESDATI